MKKIKKYELYLLVLDHFIKNELDWVNEIHSSSPIISDNYSYVRSLFSKWYLQKKSYVGTLLGGKEYSITDDWYRFIYSLYKDNSWLDKIIDSFIKSFWSYAAIKSKSFTFLQKEIWKIK